MQYTSQQTTQFTLEEVKAASIEALAGRDLVQGVRVTEDQPFHQGKTWATNEIPSGIARSAICLYIFEDSFC